MTLQDEERRRIARDLHDTTGQTLGAIKMTLASLQQAGADAPDVLRLVEDLNALADEASREIRTTSYLLHPPLLDGLWMALRNAAAFKCIVIFRRKCSACPGTVNWCSSASCRNVSPMFIAMRRPQPLASGFN